MHTLAHHASVVVCSLIVSVDALAVKPQRINDAPVQSMPHHGGTADWWSAAQAAIGRTEYEITRRVSNEPLATGVENDGLQDDYQAPNRAQNFRIHFRQHGIRISPRIVNKGESPPWEWGLSFTAMGREGEMVPVGPGSLCVDGHRAEYQRRNVVEWYINDERGLEQGFTIHQRPNTPNSGALLRLEMALSGNTTATPADDGSAVDFLAPGGALAIRLANLHVIDAMGRALPAWFAIDTAMLIIAVDDTQAIYPITIDPLATSPSWTATGGQASVFLGNSVASAGDVNGDGFSDVIVGAPGFNGNTGRAFVFHGSASGLSVAPNWTADGSTMFDQFGFVVATAGDVNGDGYSEVIVSSPLFGGLQGKVWVYYGSADGLSPTANWEQTGTGAVFIGGSIATAGDVNGDGFSDIIVGAVGAGPFFNGMAYVYHGSAGGLSTTVSWSTTGVNQEGNLGGSVATAGDVNGDGYSDVIIGAALDSNGHTQEGRAFVFHGSASGLGAAPAWTGEGNQNSAYFGQSVSTAGDVNGDGYSDVIVGAPDDNFFGAVERAYVYHGSATGLSPTANWVGQNSQAASDYGAEVSTSGDVNGDGFSDVIVAIPLFDNGQTDEGEVLLYHGSPSGLSVGNGWPTEGNQANSYFGWSVGTAGDVNGDGYSDVIVGANKYDGAQTDEGRASVFHGVSYLIYHLNPDPNSSVSGDQPDSQFGSTVAAAGDVNGDGYGDVMVGAYLYDNGQSDEGRVFVYHGSSVGLSATPDWSAESNQANSSFGYYFGAAGDVNGDGYSDVIISASNYDNDLTDEGRVFVYHGSSAGLSTTADWMAESDQSSSNFGLPAGTAGDVNGDGFADVIIAADLFDNGLTDAGRVFVYHGSSAGLSPTPSWIADGDQATARFGWIVDTAGDVNGDGFSDVLITAVLYDNGQINEGSASVYYGSSTGLGAVNWTVEGNSSSGLFGRSACGAGDTNGDGFSDIVVGEPGYQGGLGRVVNYLGSASGLGAQPVSITPSGFPMSVGLGLHVAGAGDTNGDGRCEVLVASNWDFSGGNYVSLLAGGPFGTGPIPYWYIEMHGPPSSQFFGAAGDVNGDGFSDVIFGKSVSLVGADVHFGRPGFPSLRPQQRRADDSAPVALLGHSGADDSLRLAKLGRSLLGRGLVKLEWEVKPLGAPFTGTGVQQSQAFADSGTAGVTISGLVSGLSANTPYHWRLRTVYALPTSPFQSRGLWMTNGVNGWNEADLRTGVVAAPACPGDISGNQQVNIDDLVAVITAWGNCQPPPLPCPADIAPRGGNGVVNIDDLVTVITGWGNCPP